MSEETPVAPPTFGDLPLNQSQTKSERQWTPVCSLNPEMEGQQVLLRGRVHRVRGRGKATFLLLREQMNSVQCCGFVPDVSRDFVKFAGKISRESIVDIVGIVSVPPNPTSATVSTVEIQMRELWVVNRSAPVLPFALDDAAAPEGEEGRAQVTLPTRLDNRIIDLRVPTNLAIFKIQAAVGRYFREFLYARDFIEIHSPKLIGGTSEGGSAVFRLKYFDTDACLAQSPQLYKQMCITADMERVFEIGPVFRAETSFTHRHLCEFVGLDLEVAFKEHYHEVLELLGEMLRYMLSNLQNNHEAEISTIRTQYPSTPFLIPDKVPIYTFAQCIDWLNADTERILGDEELVATLTKEERHSIRQLEQTEDIDTVNEKRLGRIIREMFNTDLYIVDKFPLALRPFYTMPDPEDSTWTNSYDIFLRGEEICSGAQRIHDVELLTERAIAKEIEVDTITGYLDAFRFGVSPHAGAGLGLERIVMLFLGLPNIRKTSLFPRDPHRLSP